MNCIYRSFDGYKEPTGSGGGNVIIKQNSTSNQGVNINVNVGPGTSVNIDALQNSGSNQLANATVSGLAGALIDQIAGIAQGIGVKAPSNSNVTANTGQTGKVDAVAIVKSIG